MPGANLSGSTAELSAAERETLWEQALYNNTLPDFVQARLVAAGERRTPWLSTMTPAELLLAQSHGIRPVATVSGTCWFHYGYSWTEGHAQGWRTALARLKHEAELAGANAIVDVKLRRVSIEVEGSMDYTLLGTAVQVEGLPPSKDPIVSTVPALEFVRLLEAGIVPVGLAVGAKYEWLTPWNIVDGSWSAWNRPLPQLGEFWENVRQRAIAELARDAGQSGNGVLAQAHFGQLIRVEQDQQPTRFLGRHIVMGTVVDTGTSRGFAPSIQTIVDMRDRDSPFSQDFVKSRNQGPVNEESGEI